MNMIKQNTGIIMEALKNREFKAYYQPQYDAITHRLVSAEALAHWEKPDGTLVPPADFVPVLEKDEGILLLDWYILREVCALLKKQKAEGIPTVPVSVNFSRMHVMEEDFTKNSVPK